jgi:V8-like Glu-specific endopeptidase
MPCPDGLEQGIWPDDNFRNSLCQIVGEFRAPDGSDKLEYGTGMLFRTRNESSYIVTAAHVIFAPRLGRFCERATLYFGREGADQNAIRTAQNWWVPEAFEHSNNADPRWDFGVFRVNKVAGADFKAIPLFRSTAPRAPQIAICGYPNEGACQNSGLAFHARAQLVPVNTGNFDYADLSSYEGMSGGPLLRTEDGVLASWGVHIRGDDPSEPRRAVRFNERNMSIIAGWLGETP